MLITTLIQRPWAVGERATKSARARSNGAMATARKTWYQLLVTESLIPLLLIFLTPIFMISYVHFAITCRSRVAEVTNRGGFIAYLKKVLSDVDVKDPQCWSVVLVFAVWSAAVPYFIGGKKFYGPLTTNGHRPQYIDSAFRYFLLSTVVYGGILLTFPVAWSWYLKLFPLTCITAAFGLICSVVFFIKGFVAPSPGVNTSTGNPLFDFYWGKELYPRFGRWLDLKQWSITFYGMMGWYAVVLLCWKAQYEQIGWNWAMAASAMAVTVYMAKFYCWYYGYCNSLDIIHDRLGFYLGWGGIGLMPPFLSCNAVYMVENPSDFGPITCLIILALGALMVLLTYLADMQRLQVREANGKCTVWGKPAKVIRAHYRDEKGIKRDSLLLASGYWGVVRHLNYVVELSSNLLMILPAKMDSLVPYLWLVFLFGILAQRLGRDDNRCKNKYGKFWEEYCRLVPYQMIPGIF